MLLQTAAPVTLIPPASQFRVELTIDLAAHIVRVIVQQPGVPALVDTAPIPAGLQTNLENYAQARAEVLLGVAPGSTTIAAP